jgi:nucleoid DNA-binding protein
MVTNKPAGVKPARNTKSATQPAKPTAGKIVEKPAVKKPVASKPAEPNADVAVSPPTSAARAKPEQVTGSGNIVKLKDLLEEVSKSTGSKKKSIKEAVIATLAALGAALSRGDDLNLPSVGKAHVNRQRTLADGEMIIVKMRRNDMKGQGKKAAVAPLAEEDN